MPQQLPNSLLVSIAQPRRRHRENLQLSVQFPGFIPKRAELAVAGALLRPNSTQPALQLA